MKFKSKTTVMITSLLLAYSLCYASVGHAASDLKRDQGEHHHDHDRHSHSDAKLSKEEIQQLRLEKLVNIATYFGIDPNGKSFEQLKIEVSNAKKSNPEKWEAFKQDHQQNKLEELKKFAEQQGIDVEGKDIKQLKEALDKK